MKPVRHRPRIHSTEEYTPEGWASVHRLHCGCGTQGPPRYRKTEAAQDVAHHRADVLPPESDRCREPRAHGNHPHDHCPLCANQFTLPGFEYLTATHV